MKNLWCIVGLIVVCGAGCTSVERLAEVLNDRQLTSCIWFTGNAGPYASVRTVTATGGAQLNECFNH